MSDPHLTGNLAAPTAFRLDAIDLELAPSGFPFVYAVVPVRLHANNATHRQVRAGLDRYQRRTAGPATPAVLPLDALPAAWLEARTQGEDSNDLLHGDRSAIALECWSFGPPVTIQLTEAAAVAWVQAHEDNSRSADGDACVLCGEDLVFVAVPYDTAPCTDSWLEPDGSRRWTTACDDSWWGELRHRLQLSGR